MRVHFAVEEIYGKKPAEVARLFRLRGLNPERPYRARLAPSGITIEQEGWR